jgi:hypothetical protein
MTWHRDDPVGLCRRCLYSRVVATPRSLFWLCGRASSDRSFEKYPRLPVTQCPGFAERIPAEPVREPD